MKLVEAEGLFAELDRERGDAYLLYLIERFRLRIWFELPTIGRWHEFATDEMKDELATGEMQVESLNRRKEP